MSEESGFDARLARAEPGLPGVLTVLDTGLLRRWAGAHGVAVPGLRVDRLRHKPATSLRAALDPGDGGPWWLLTAYSAVAWRKAGKDVRAAERAGGRAVVDERLRLVLAPAAGDRALPWLRGRAAGRTVAHNPARRAVLRETSAGVVTKVHADPHTAVRSARAADSVRRAGIVSPALELDGRHVAAARWVPGAPVRPGADLGDLLERMATADVTGLPVLGRRDLASAVERAAAGTPRLDAGFDDRLRRTVSGWHRLAGRGRDLEPRGFAHGDLSPDQLLQTDEGVVVLDLDRACRAPRGWDRACWAAATAREDGGSPVLVAAAALLRAPEPFRRRRPGWAAATRALVELAARAVAS
ncbi:protein kinase family protein [Kineococcus sp. SYSU DK003]|uniref:hypothetical protein n=1 Tax=Kineococcus sp. SYSU DK003 TaxID=3383124 RepID=UPI003D7DB6AA